MLKAAELRQLNPDELLEKAGSLRKEHFQLRLEAKTGKLEKSNRLHDVRKNIARVLTIHHELTRGQAPVPQAKPAGEVRPKAPKVPVRTEKVMKVEKPQAKKEGAPQKGFFGQFKKAKPEASKKEKAETKKTVKAKKK